jgi:hypothetical protein
LWWPETFLAPSGHLLAECQIDNGPSSTPQLQEVDTASIAECVQITNKMAEKSLISFTYDYWKNSPIQLKVP